MEVERPGSLNNISDLLFADNNNDDITFQALALAPYIYRYCCRQRRGKVHTQLALASNNTDSCQ